nr:probable cytosolic oligopeptidase A [Tanacetum cinerariifolium]
GIKSSKSGEKVPNMACIGILKKNKDVGINRFSKLSSLDPQQFVRLAKLSQKFNESVLDATTNFKKLITDKREIEGLQATSLGLDAQPASSKGHENVTAEIGPLMITLDAPSFMSAMQHAKNRALDEEIYRAYTSRAAV